MGRLHRTVVALLVLAAGLVLVDVQPAAAAQPMDVVTGVAAAGLPALARRSLPLISDLTASACPELPPLWVVAQVQAESGWDASARSASPGGAAGLYQLTQSAWVAAGGSPWASDPPADGAAVLSPEAHLRVAVPWVCANLRAVTAHLAATDKPTTPLDAMLVCHVAGCARVTGSRTGVPAPGEAGCDDRCARLVQRYLTAVHDNVARFAAPTPGAPALSGGIAPRGSTAADGSALDPAVPTPRPSQAPDLPNPTGSARGASPGPRYPDAPSRKPDGAGPLALPMPSPPSVGRPPVPALLPAAPAVAPSPTTWAGGATRCTPPDPTSGGCLTGATRHGLDAVGAAFGGFHDGPVVHSTGCWDRHAWNPSSDHSRGKACDFMVTRPGTFAKGTERDNGWAVANWLRANAGPLQVKYLIWQGRYWDPNVHDDAGSWGSRYTGAGIYDVRNATGGHFDHVHASFRE